MAFFTNGKKMAWWTSATRLQKQFCKGDKALVVDSFPEKNVKIGDKVGESCQAKLANLQELVADLPLAAGILGR